MDQYNKSGIANIAEENLQSGDQTSWSAKRNGYGGGYGYGGYGEQSEDSESLAHYWHAIVYRKWIVAGVLATALILGYAFAETRIPVYRSTAMVEVEKVYPHSAGITDLFTLFGQSEIFYQTQIELLKSQNVVSGFLNIMNASSNKSKSGLITSTDKSKASGPRSGPQDTIKDESLNAAVQAVQATPVKGTQLIEVQMDADDPRLAQEMLGAYFQAFVEETQRKRSELAEKLRSWLRKELQETEKQLRDSERELHDFQVKYGFLDNDPSHSQSFLNRAGENLVQSKDTRLQLEALQKQKDPDATASGAKRIPEFFKESTYRAQIKIYLHESHLYPRFLQNGNIRERNSVIGEFNC